MKLNRYALLPIALSLFAGTATSAPLQQKPNHNANHSYMNAARIEQKAIEAGVVSISEIEMEGRLAEVEGRDAQKRKIKLVVDRKTGEVLQQKIKSMHGDQ